MNDSTHQDVLDWVIAAQNGSTDAFRQLHRRFVASVHGVLLSRFRPSIAEELTQECFLIAFRKLSQLRDPRKFGPWIVAIARRVDALEERHHYVPMENEEIVDARIRPEVSIDAMRVLDVIQSLPQAYRETLVMRLAEGMSAIEIAEVTGLTPESVRVNLHRGIRKLRDALAVDLEIVGASAHD